MNEFGRDSARQRDWYWQPISTAGLVAFIFGSAWLMLLLATDEDGFLLIVDSFNLVIHEAGHPIFGVFGESMGLWGGTLAQLVVPIIVAVAFWRQRAALSLAIAGVWFFENFLNVARYMADARDQFLPLVGGGEHDWTNILTRHGLLEDDKAIASVVRAVGWAGMVACVAVAAAMWYSQRRHEPVAATDFGEQLT